MLNRILLCLALTAFVLGCRPEQQNSGGAMPNANPPTSSTVLAEPTTTNTAIPDGKEELVLTIVLPPSAEKLTTAATSGHGGGCPQSTISALLGVEIINPHGFVLGKVLPEGLAAKAGLKPGDSIVKCDGISIACPRTLLPFMGRNDKPRMVKITVFRTIEGQNITNQTTSEQSLPK